jgi:hypothetical protein
MNGKNTIVVLGAGASRGVSYADECAFPSPLDYDFFDLLQRLNPKSGDRKAVRSVLDKVATLPREYWRSFERAFYTLQLKAYLSKKLELDGPYESDTRVVTDFALCVHALLREAHGRNTKCDYHEAILTPLEGSDSVITFNYDLVVERSIRGIAKSRSAGFGRWLYGFRTLSTPRKLPLLLKLHGSSNWRLNASATGDSDKQFEIRTKEWKDFDEAPGYTRIAKTEIAGFPIFLPFWDKRIERRPWVTLWREALEKLRAAENVVVWGYSMPPTDVKAYLLFTLGLSGRPLNLCVIDPKDETRERWRNLFHDSKYWEYKSADKFLKYRPSWFGAAGA